MKKDIGRILFEKRIERKLSLKEAAEGLLLSKFKLYLIEHDILNVSDNYKPHFISFYSLDKDFFEKDYSFTPKKNKGINKILYSLREERGLSLKEAAKEFKISKLKLSLIENGYFSPSRNLQLKFIEYYNLDKDFFVNDLNYPVMIEEEKTKIVGSFWHKLFHSFWFKVTCFFLAFASIGLGATGAVMNNYTKTNTSSFYNQAVLTMRDRVRTNPDVVYNYSDPEAFIDGINDRLYIVNNSYESPEEHNLPKTNIIFAEKEKNILFTTLNGIFNVEETIDVEKESEEEKILTTFIKNFISRKPVKLKTIFTVRYLFNSTRVKCMFYPLDYIGDQPAAIGSVTATIVNDWKDNNFKINDVSFTNLRKELKSIDEEHKLYPFFKKVFTNNAPTFLSSTDSFLSSNHVSQGTTNLSDFSNNFSSGTRSFSIFNVSSYGILIGGIVFTCFFLALGVLFIFKRRPEDTIEVVQNNIQSSSVSSISIDEISRNNEPLKRNWKVFPIFPGNLLKFISITMIFLYSLAFYFLFCSLSNHQLIQTANIMSFFNWFGPILIIAFLLLFFVKLDIVQKMKNYFLTNYFWFFSGLALYILYVFISESVYLDNTAASSVGKLLLDVLPGNFLWGFLAFNTMVLLLFYKPVTFGDNKKKLLGYRLLAILPVSYLVISLILELGASYGGWVIPYSINSLFFTKAVDLLIFALLYTFAMFIYQKLTIRKYGKENAELYQHGNRYYFIRNIIAAVIVLGIGIFELGFHFGWPNNPIGMGEDYLILCAIPFILLYHPHHGKRNAKWDNIFLAYYDTAYVIGIVLILLSVITSLLCA